MLAIVFLIVGHWGLPVDWSHHDFWIERLVLASDLIDGWSLALNLSDVCSVCMKLHMGGRSGRNLEQRGD